MLIGYVSPYEGIFGFIFLPWPSALDIFYVKVSIMQKTGMPFIRSIL